MHNINSVFPNNNKKSHLSRTCFFDESVDIARYDRVKYQFIEKLNEKQLSFFWRPEEVDLSKDFKDFKLLSDHEKDIFTLTLRRQILLDSIQGRAPSLLLLPICSLPELEVWIQTWSFFETIHSKSYTHIIRNVYSDPSKVFDDMLNIKEIVDCSNDISKYYDCMFDAKEPTYENKKKLWLCLNAINALEGIRFYTSFACSWNFAELKKMEGNAKIIKFIARDENLHLAFTQQILKVLPKDDLGFAKIQIETLDEVREMFLSVVEQEKQWAKFLFKDGSMIGLNEKMLVDYLEWIAHKRMQSIGISSPFKVGSNPLPFTQKWIAGSEIQVAPQEAAISSYTIGDIIQDVSDDTFREFSL